MKAIRDHVVTFVPCVVCGKRASYTHKGAAYCVRNDCQLVAAEMRTTPSRSTGRENRTMSETYLTGTTIRYKINNLGLIGRPECVSEGELGRVLGPAEDDGWILTEPAKLPGAVCPVSPGMIERAA